MTRDFHRIGKILEQAAPFESRIQKMLDQQSSIAKAAQGIHVGSAFETLHRHHKIIGQQTLAFQSMARVSEIGKIGQRIKELTSFSASLANATRFNSSFANINALSRLTNNALFDTRQIGAIAKDLSMDVGLSRHLAVSKNWSSILESQMLAVRSPWLDIHHPSLSFEGFATVSRLTQTLRNSQIHDGWAREIIDEDLGEPITIDDDASPEERDEAHIDAGMNETMLAIAPSAVGEVLVQTGFILKAEYMPIPEIQSEDEYDLTFNPNHNMMITVVEQNLRRVIEARMASQYGSDWMSKRVDSKLVDGWSEKREQAVQNGEPKLSLIHYSNFMDLKDIVIRREHWRVLFSTIFREKNHFEVAMERLHPIRIPLSHSRPIGVAAQYHLISETAHILKALGIDIFKK